MITKDEAPSRSKISLLTVCIFLLWVSLCLLAQGQEQILQRSIPSFAADNVSRLDAVLMLAKQQHVPLGIEYAGPKLFDLITLRLGPTDLGTIMESLFPSNTGFEVRTQNGVLVITDRAVSKNKTNILDTKLSNFSIPRCSIQRAYVLLSTQLRRQLSPSGYDRGVAGSISGEGSTEIEAFVLTDATVREALNRIVTERKDAAWIVQVRPELLVQTNDGDVEKRFANGNLALWTIVEYDSSLMNNVGKVIKAHALATLQ